MWRYSLLNKKTYTMTEDKEEHVEVPKEISILKRNLRLLKRIIFGKKKPPLFLRVVSILAIVWSLLTIIALLSILALLLFSSDVAVVADLQAIDLKFYISYAGLHLVTVLAVILMWRQKIFGYYLFILTNLLMPFWVSFFLPVFRFNVYFLIPSGAFIFLFGIYFWVLKLKHKKEEEKKELPEDNQEKEQIEQ